MQQFRLIKPAPELEKEYGRFAADWSKNGEKIVPFAAGYDAGTTYAQWIEDTRRAETAAPEGEVPSHTFLMVEKKKIVGAVNVRHTLNKQLLLYGGHITFGVRPSCRGQGISKELLRLALEFARRQGMNRLLVTCDSGNIAACRTILSCGGVLENEVEHNGFTIRRYWFSAGN